MRNKILGWMVVNFPSFIGFKNIKSTSLTELIISLIVVSIMVLSFYSLENFSHQQVLGADRRAKVQNNLAYCLEHMSKYIQMASGRSAGGTSGRKAIVYYPDPLVAGSATGFRVYIDFMPTQTPSDFTDDGYIDYTLSANTLTATCSAGTGGGICPFATEELTNQIIQGVVGGAVLPEPLPDPLVAGFYVKTDPLGNFIDIGLIGRHDPTNDISKGADLTTPEGVNPQVAMKTRLFCNNSSTN